MEISRAIVKSNFEIPPQSLTWNQKMMVSKSGSSPFPRGYYFQGSKKNFRGEMFFISPQHRGFVTFFQLLFDEEVHPLYQPKEIPSCIQTTVLADDLIWKMRLEKLVSLYIHISYIYIPCNHGTGIFTYIWLRFMVNLGKYTIHGFCGYVVTWP